jgi:hypothetical protein
MSEVMRRGRIWTETSYSAWNVPYQRFSWRVAIENEPGETHPKIPRTYS